MRVRRWTLVALVILLLVGTTIQVGARGRYAVKEGVASADGYRLTTLTWQVSGAVGGGGYRLLPAASPELRGSGCCCLYMPCTIRNQP